MDVYQQYANNLKLEFVKIDTLTKELIIELEAGNYEKVMEGLRAIELHCSFFTAQVKYRESVDKVK